MTSKAFILDCWESNPGYYTFRLFDRRGANCGTITVLTEDVLEFVRDNWRGELRWNGRMPIETKP